MVVIRRIKRATSRKPKVLKRSTVAKKKKPGLIKPLSATLKRSGFSIAKPQATGQPAVGMTRSGATALAKTYKGGGHLEAKVIRRTGGHAVIVRDRWR